MTYPVDGHPFAETIRIATCDPATDDSELDALGRRMLEDQARLVVSLMSQPRFLDGILPFIVAALPPREVVYRADPTRLRQTPLVHHTFMSRFGALIGAILGFLAGLIALYFIDTGVFFVFTDKDTQLSLSSGADLLPYQLLTLLCATGIGWGLGHIFSPDPVTETLTWYDTSDGDPILLPNATLPAINRQEA